MSELLQNVYMQAECTHGLAEREFGSIWVSYELRKAVEKGYSMSEVSEIWQYKVTRYDPDTRQGGLFTGLFIY